MKLTIAFLFVACSLAIASSSKDQTAHKIVCYYESWARNLSGDAKVLPGDLDPTSCTHLIYAFATLKNSTIGFIGKKAVEEEALRQFVALRLKNRHLKVMVAIGGWTDGSTKYSNMVKSPLKRQVFVASVVNFLKAYNLDGIDIDWEYPTYIGEYGQDRTVGRMKDRADFSGLLANLKQAFRPYGFILSATVPGDMAKIAHAYDVPSISRSVDFLNVLAFDYPAEGPHTAYTSPLYAASRSKHDQENNAAATVDYLVRSGAPAAKLVLGIPLYGKAFKLAGVDSQVGAKAVSVNDAPTYKQLCSTLSKSGWSVHFDSVAKASYAVQGHQFVSYDSEEVIKAKVDYAREKALAGVFVWAIDNDDVKGSCGKGKSPAVKAIMKQLYAHQ